MSLPEISRAFIEANPGRVAELRRAGFIVPEWAGEAGDRLQAKLEEREAASLFTGKFVPGPGARVDFKADGSVEQRANQSPEPLARQKGREAWEILKEIGEPAKAVKASERADHRAEATLQAQIHSYLTEHGPLAGRCYVVRPPMHRRPVGLPKGYPDFTVFYPGGVIFLEVKTSTGRISDDQMRCHIALAKAGYITEVVRTFDEAREIIRQAAGVEEGKV